jgi:hypothetical protein
MPQDDDDFEAQLLGFLEPTRDLNPDFADVDIVMAPEVEAKIWEKHRVTRVEVEEAIKGCPPEVEVAFHEDPLKVQFWGETRLRRPLYIAGAWKPPVVPNRRLLAIASAFEPTDGVDYWLRQKRGAK